MSSPSLATCSAAKLPVGCTVAEVLDEANRAAGMEPFVHNEAEVLPPWTEEEAAAFEHSINEVFEQIEAPAELP